MSTRTASSLGVATVALALAGDALAVFGSAVYLYPPPATVPTGTASLWSSGALASILPFVVATAAAALAIAAGLYLRAAGAGGGAPLTLIGALVVIAGTIVTLPGNSTLVTPAALAADIPDAVGIGIYLVPAAVSALIATVAAIASGSPSTSVSLDRYANRP